MKRLYTAIALCFLLVWGCIWSFSTVDSKVGSITKDIESGDIDSAYAKWDDAGTLLGALLLHDELDRVDRLFARVQASISTGEAAGLKSDIAELLTQLKSLPELEKPSIKNIF